jgi:hypothetical protein
MDLLNLLKTIDNKIIDFVFESNSRYLLSPENLNLNEFEDRGSFDVDVDNNFNSDLSNINNKLKDEIHQILSRNVDTLMLQKVSNILIMKNGMPIFVLCYDGDMNKNNKYVIIDIGLIHTELWKYNNDHQNGIYNCLKRASIFVGLGFVYLMIKDKK